MPARLAALNSVGSIFLRKCEYVRTYLERGYPSRYRRVDCEAAAHTEKYTAADFFERPWEDLRLNLKPSFEFAEGTVID